MVYETLSQSPLSTGQTVQPSGLYRHAAWLATYLEGGALQLHIISDRLDACALYFCTRSPAHHSCQRGLLRQILALQRGPP